MAIAGLQWFVLHCNDFRNMDQILTKIEYIRIEADSSLFVFGGPVIFRGGHLCIDGCNLTGETLKAVLDLTYTPIMISMPVLSDIHHIIRAINCMFEHALTPADILCPVEEKEKYGLLRHTSIYTSAVPVPTRQPVQPCHMVETKTGLQWFALDNRDFRDTALLLAKLVKLSRQHWATEVGRILLFKNGNLVLTDYRVSTQAVKKGLALDVEPVQISIDPCTSIYNIMTCINIMTGWTMTPTDLVYPAQQPLRTTLLAILFGANQTDGCRSTIAAAQLPLHPSQDHTYNSRIPLPLGQLAVKPDRNRYLWRMYQFSNKTTHFLLHYGKRTSQCTARRKMMNFIECPELTWTSLYPVKTIKLPDVDECVSRHIVAKLLDEQLCTTDLMAYKSGKVKSGRLYKCRLHVAIDTVIERIQAIVKDDSTSEAV